MSDPNQNVEEQWLNEQWKAKAKENENSEENGDSGKFSEEELLKHDTPLPEPTLISLVSGVAAQAMVSMGAIPNPMTGKTLMMLNQSKHLIDTVAMLFEKTKGNQTPEEAETLENVLHELRMLFVAAQNEKKRRDA